MSQYTVIPDNDSDNDNDAEADDDFTKINKVNTDDDMNMNMNMNLDLDLDLDLDLYNVNYNGKTLSRRDPSSSDRNNDNYNNNIKNKQKQQQQQQRRPYEEEEYDPNTFHQGTIVLPMSVDFFGNHDNYDNHHHNHHHHPNDRNQNRTKQPSTIGFQADIPRSCGGKWNAQFGTYSVIDTDLNIGGSSGQVSVGYLASTSPHGNVHVMGTLEMGPNANISLSPTYQTNHQNTTVTCHLSQSTRIQSTTQQSLLQQQQQQQQHHDVAFHTKHFFWNRNALADIRCSTSYTNPQQLVYSQLSLTTLFPNVPTCTLNLFLGNHIPINHTNTPFSSSIPSTRDFSSRQHSLLSQPLCSCSISSQSLSSFKNKYRFGTMEMGIGKNGQMYWQALWTRVISNVTQISVGIRHLSSHGLIWLFQLERGNIHLNIPITVSSHTATNSRSFVEHVHVVPSYPMQVFVMSILSTWLDGIIGRLMNHYNIPTMTNHNNQNDNHNQNETESNTMYMEEQLLQLEKAKQDAQTQVMLMSKQARSKQRKEETKHGLVILSAIYTVLDDDDNDDDDECDSLDVVTQLQFWVVNSKLRLPASSKSHLLGFYDVTISSSSSSSSSSKNTSNPKTTTKETETSIKAKKESESTKQNTTLLGSLVSFWKNIHWNFHETTASTSSSSLLSSSPPPKMATLTVRYKFNQQIYEKTIRDDEALNLPCPDATLIEENNESTTTSS